MKEGGSTAATMTDVAEQRACAVAEGCAHHIVMAASHISDWEQDAGAIGLTLLTDVLEEISHGPLSHI